MLKIIYKIRRHFFPNADFTAWEVFESSNGQGDHKGFFSGLNPKD